MKKLFLTLGVLFLVSCSKNDSAQTSTTSSDSLGSDTMATSPDSTMQNDSTMVTGSGSVSDSSATSVRRDSAK